MRLINDEAVREGFLRELDGEKALVNLVNSRLTAGIDILPFYQGVETRRSSKSETDD